MSFAIIDHGPAQAPTPAPEQTATEALRVSVQVSHAFDAVIPEAAQRVAAAVLTGVQLRQQLKHIELGAAETGLTLLSRATYGVPSAAFLIGAAVAGSGFLAAAALVFPGLAYMFNPPVLRNDHEVGPAALVRLKGEYAIAADANQPPYLVEAARHGMIAALEAARRQRGLCAEAELWLQDLKFATPTDAAADAAGARIAQVADILYVNSSRTAPSCYLEGLDPLEVVALQNRLLHRTNGPAVTWMMNRAVEKAFKDIAQAQRRTSARL